MANENSKNINFFPTSEVGLMVYIYLVNKKQGLCEKNVIKFQLPHFDVIKKKNIPIRIFIDVINV